MRVNTIKDELGSFINSIASSNLEPLHSKAIAWLLNLSNSPIDVKDFFLSTIFNSHPDTAFEHIVTIAEVANHDLLSLVSINNEFRLVIWENKIKADFHQKKKDQLPLSDKIIESKPVLKRINEILKKYDTDWLRGISQPFWYQIRWLLWTVKNDNEIKEKIIIPLIDEDKKKKNQLKKVIENKLGSTANKVDRNALVKYISENIKIDWVILSPHEEKNIKIFHKSQWKGFKYFDKYSDSEQINGDSDLLEQIIKTSGFQSNMNWKYINYHQLYSKINHYKKDNTVAHAYLYYLKTSNDFNTIRFDNGGDQQKYEWDLDHLLKIHSKLNGDNLDFEWLVSGSERNPNPLLNIILSTIPLNKKNTYKLNDILDIPEDVKKSKINEIGVKIQIQGKIKLQFAHLAYHHVKLKDNSVENYKEFIFQLISQDWNTSFKSKEDRLKFISNNLFSGVNTELIVKENSPSSKSGLSYTIDNPKQGFMDEKNVVEIIKAISTYLDIYSFND
ncbi:MAG: hypothetical protein ACON5K_11555 [Bacteroidia bacterium]